MNVKTFIDITNNNTSDNTVLLDSRLYTTTGVARVLERVDCGILANLLLHPSVSGGLIHTSAHRVLRPVAREGRMTIAVVRSILVVTNETSVVLGHAQLRLAVDARAWVGEARRRKFYAGSNNFSKFQYPTSNASTVKM